MQKLFEVCVLFHPKPRSKESEARPSEILVDLKRVLAKDEKTVAMLAAREIPETHVDKLDQVEVLIRPF